MDLIKRYTERKFLHVTSYAIIICSLLLLLITFLKSDDNPTLLGTDKGYDFSALYIAGTILKDYGAKDLYDASLQNKLYRELRPYLSETSALPNPYPPFFNSIFKPLAFLPFSYSYGIWLMISACLYIFGLKIVLSKTTSFNAREKYTILLLAVSFEPFIMECWLGGQTSSFGFFFIALAIYFFKINKPFISGMFYGLCLYKPPLLLILAPFFLITRQYRICLGILLTSVLIVIYTLLFLGLNSLVDWFSFVFQHFNSAADESAILRIYKFVDIVSLTRMLFGSLRTGEIIFIMSFFICWVLYTFVFLKIFQIDDKNKKEIALALIIVWSTVINIYFPIYDTIVVTLSLIIVVDIQNSGKTVNHRILNIETKIILISIYIVPWVTFIFAQKLNFQLYSIVLISVGIFIGRLFKMNTSHVGR